MTQCSKAINREMAMATSDSHKHVVQNALQIIALQINALQITALEINAFQINALSLDQTRAQVKWRHKFWTSLYSLTFFRWYISYDSP